MTDERHRKHRAGSHWDAEQRAAWGRRHDRARTPGAGIPVEVDPELTPPPSPPPEPETFERMSPTEQLAALHAQALTNQHGIAALWPARKAPDEVEAVKAAVDGYTRQVDRHQALLDELIQPGLRSNTVRIATLEQVQTESLTRMRVFFETEWPAHKTVIGEISSALKDITERIGRIETRQDKFADSITTHEARITSVEKQINAMDVRVTALERHNADEKLVNQTATSTEQKLFTRARMAFMAVGVALSFLVTKGPAIVAWLGKLGG